MEKIENIESTVNAEPVVNVEQQENEFENVENVESEQEEVATSQQTKTVQSHEENSKYAEIRRKAEMEARDKTIADMGMEWNGSPITNYSEYQKALEEQKEYEKQREYAEQGIDYDLIKELIKEDPAIKQANEIIEQQRQEQKINTEIDQLFQEFPEAINSDIPNEVFTDHLNNGIPLVYAYAKYASKNALNLAEQKTLRNITQNAQTSPGALGNPGTFQANNSIKNMSRDDFKKLQDEVLRGERKTI